jgi:MFS family permease
MCIGSAILIQTKIIPFLFIGRLIQGSFVGAGTSIVPLYIKEFIPQMNGKYGIYHQMFFIGGVLSAFLLNMLFYLANMNA